MDRIWITNGSTSVAPIVNPLIAACHEGYIPTAVHILENPAIEDVTASAATLMKTAVTAHGGDEPMIERTSIEEETDFAAIIDYLRGAIEAGTDAGATIAVDVTPGRKFWSIISFRAGFEYDVDHLHYLHVQSGDYFGESYPTIPRPAVELIDFTEVV